METKYHYHLSQLFIIVFGLVDKCVPEKHGDGKLRKLVCYSTPLVQGKFLPTTGLQTNVPEMSFEAMFSYSVWLKSNYACMYRRFEPHSIR